VDALGRVLVIRKKAASPEEAALLRTVESEDRHVSSSARKNGSSAGKAPQGRGRLSLRLKFILWVVSVVMYLCLAMAVAFVWLTENNARRELLQTARNQAGIVALESGRRIQEGDREALSSLARSFAESEDVLYVIISDEAGRTVASAGRVAERSAGPDAAGPLRGAEASAPGRPERREGHEIVEASAPIVVPDPAEARGGDDSSRPPGKVQIGTVTLGYTTSRQETAVLTIARQLAPLMLLSCAISIIGTIIVERKITRPVAELVKATKAIADGNLGRRVSIHSRDEFGDLAKSFNHMADNLTVTMVKLENYSKRLEETVHERTRELEGKTRALQRANAELEKLDNLKSDFLSNVSHELRTPLTSIRAVAELLARKGAELPTEQTVEFLKIIETQTDRLTRLVSDILDLSSIENGGGDVRPQEVSVIDAASEAVKSVQGIAAERGITITTNIPDDLPRAFSERDKVIQVLINLLGNALKFTPEGGHIEVSARLLEKEGVWHGSPRPISGIVVSVADNGPGIPADKLEAIFDRFKQIRNASGGHPGSGLGLSISKEIVERYGGTIWAESELGKGSVFHFTMEPVREPAERPATDAREPGAGQSADGPTATAA